MFLVSNIRSNVMSGLELGSLLPDEYLAPAVGGDDGPRGTCLIPGNAPEGAACECSGSVPIFGGLCVFFGNSPKGAACEPSGSFPIL